MRLRVLAFPCAGVVGWLLPKRLRINDAIANKRMGGKSAFFELELDGDGDERREMYVGVLLCSHRVVKIREGV